MTTSNRPPTPVPAFSNPPGSRPPLLPQDQDQDVGVAGLPDGSGVARDLPIPRASGLTSTSDTPPELADPDLVAGLVSALTGLALTVAAVLIARLRPTRRLRRPTDKAVGQWSGALARIGLRHLEIVKLNKDLSNGLIAAGAVGSWVEEGPILVPHTEGTQHEPV